MADEKKQTGRVEGTQKTDEEILALGRRYLVCESKGISPLERKMDNWPGEDDLDIKVHYSR